MVIPCLLFAITNSNTTNVKVKHEAIQAGKMAQKLNSNTTNVKVKQKVKQLIMKIQQDSNTTNVKVKL